MQRLINTDYERDKGRFSHRDGYKFRTLTNCVRNICLGIPQTQNRSFSNLAFILQMNLFSHRNLLERFDDLYGLHHWNQFQKQNAFSELVEVFNSSDSQI